MQTVLNKYQAKFIDSFTIDQGTSGLTLMERAAAFLAEKIEFMFRTKDRDRILFVSGNGNNGGDAVCAATILREKYPYLKMEILYLNSSKMSESLQIQHAKALEADIDYYNADTEEKLKVFKQIKGDFDIVVDGLFGVGLSREVTGLYADAINMINDYGKEGATVIAVDIASGIDADDGSILGTAVKADVTVTFGNLKRGHLIYPGRDYTGQLFLGDIGFDERAFDSQEFGPVKTVSYTISDLDKLPKRTNDSNKGTYGKVLVVAGSENMPGACIFSSKAALRSGAGLVVACSDKSVLNILVQVLPEVVLQDASEKLDFNGFNAVIVGPGLGKSDAAVKKVDWMLNAGKNSKEKAQETTKAKSQTYVLDADCLNILADRMNKEGISDTTLRIDWLTEKLPKNSILTPHKKELSRLLNVPMEDLNNLVKTAEMLSASTDLVFVLKDAATLVVTRGSIYINQSGNNGMSTAGAGDVLTGIIGAYAAGGLSAYEASKLGVYVHGLAGDSAERIYGTYGVMAGDMADLVAIAVKENLEALKASEK